MGFDLLVSENLSLDSIRSFLCKYFLYKENCEEIEVVSNIEELIHGTRLKLVVVGVDIKGDMQMLLEFYFHDQKIFEPNNTELIFKMCRHFQCKILVSDDDVNPYSFLLYSDNHDGNQIFLDTEALDERGEYVIQWT